MSTSGAATFLVLFLVLMGGMTFFEVTPLGRRIDRKVMSWLAPKSAAKEADRERDLSRTFGRDTADWALLARRALYSFLGAAIATPILLWITS